MPEKEAELTALENERPRVRENASTGAPRRLRLRLRPKRHRLAGRSLSQLQAEYDQLKKERDQLRGSAGAAAGGV